MTQETKNEEVRGLRQPCEVYKRIIGYYRPISDANESMQAMHAERVNFKLGGIDEG